MGFSNEAIEKIAIGAKAQAQTNSSQLSQTTQSLETHKAENATHLNNPVGDGVTNDYAVFLSAVATAKASKIKTLDLGANKTYYIDGDTINVSGLKIMGNNIKIKGNGQTMFEAKGSIGSFIPLNENAKRGDYSINSAIASSLVVGDLVKISSNTAFSMAGPTIMQGEIHIVQGISGTTITFYDALFDSYTTDGGAKIAKIFPTTFEITSGITIENKGVELAEFGINLKYVLRPIIKCSFNRIKYAALNIDDCYAPISDVLINGCDSNGTGYGVNIVNATMYAKTTGTILWCRHTVTHGGGTDGGVPWESHVTVNGGCDKDNGTSACFDAHPSTGSVYWENCVANGGHYGIKLHARYNYVNNFRGRTEKTESALLVVNNIANLVVDTIDIKDVVGEGYTCAFENYKPVNNLYIDGIKTNKIAIYFRSDITKWDIKNIKSKTAGINIASDIIVPSELKLSDCDFIESELVSPSYGVYNMTSTLKRIVLTNCSHVRMSALVRSATDLDVIELYNCKSVEPYMSHIYMVGITLARLVVIGGEYVDNQRNGTYFGCLLAGNVTDAIIHGITTKGVNFNYILYGTVLNLLHSGNIFHNTVIIVGNSTPIQILAGSLNAPRLMTGSGTPENVIDAPIGCEYIDYSNGIKYLKKTGTGKTGWKAYQTVT